MSNNNKVIEIKNLSFEYPDGMVALKDISLTVTKGETVGIVGANGAGKSTLLLHLNGILTGNGMVKVLGMEVNNKHLKKIRQRTGIVFQNPDDQLFCPTVFDDIAFGPRNMGLSPEEVKRRVEKSLNEMGLNGFEQKSAHHLSFGQKKRVAAATALSLDLEIIAFDEPSSNLDPNSRRSLLEIIKSLSSTKIIVTQDLYFAAELCDRLIILSEGKIVANGSMEEIILNQKILKEFQLEFGERCGICSQVNGQNVENKITNKKMYA